MNMDEFSNLRPVRWDLSAFGVMPDAWDTGRRKWLGFKSLIFFLDLDGRFNYHWARTSDVLPRAF